MGNNKDEFYFTSYGGAEEIGRSCHVIEKNNEQLMLDAGIKVLDNKVLMPTLDMNKKYENVVLSHAHTDHIGLLPLLNFTKAYASKPTKDLANIVWADQRRISGLITTKQINEANSKIKVVDYEKPFKAGSFDLTFYEAGHVLGSVMTLIDKKILYTGDFNTSGSRILNPAKAVNAEILITEATYGKDEHFLSKKELTKKFAELINSTLDKGGSVIIPSFAIGRAQEVLITLHALMTSNIIRKVPIYIDGMIKKALKIYRQNVLFARKEIQMQILASLNDPFLSPLYKVSKHKERKDIKKPCIVVSTSGMLTGGPIFYYLKLLGKDENSLLLFVGYQPDGSKGKAIIQGLKTIEGIDNETIEINARVEQIRFPGHSDYKGLLHFIRTVKPKKLIVIHREKKTADELANDIKNIEIIQPKTNETIKL
jgi:predicted metal-dependent RNase